VENRKIVSIYYEWIETNKLGHANYMVSLQLLALVILTGFDFLIFGTEQSYSSYRIILIPIYLGFLFLNKKLKDQTQLHTYLLLFPSLIFQFMYFAFLFNLSSDKQNIVFIANIMTTFFLTFTLHKFFKEQYLFNFISIFTLMCGVSFNWQKDQALVLIISHITSAMVTFYFRREFVSGLDAKLSHMKTFLPDNVAKMIMYSNDWKDISKAFTAKERFTICLCADWRNFQLLCTQKKSSEISDVIEKYYDIVIKHLEKVFPDGNYYVNWVADELFVIFYTDSDFNKEALERKVIGFSNNMATTIFEEINTTIKNWDLMYDVGISCGNGLLGLQGPSKLKKTTLTGEVAGRAKRYQEEAKRIRNDYGSAHPILVFDYSLLSTIRNIYPKLDETLQHFQAKTKDIHNQTVLVQIIDQPKKIKTPA
jgi:hypothetical protein